MLMIPPLVFAGLAAMFMWGMGREGGTPSAFEGREAPPLPETTLPGKVQLTDAMLREPGVKLVNVWASWCPPCRAEHPTLMDLSRELPVYGIDLKDNEADALEFLAEDGDPFAAIATDPRGRGAIDWGVTAPPETFILDGEGRILYRHAGPLIRDDFENRFLPRLREAQAAE